jgi:hypothetical protein
MPLNPNSNFLPLFLGFYPPQQRPFLPLQQQQRRRRRRLAGSVAGGERHGSVPAGGEAAAQCRRHQRERDPHHYPGPHPQLRHLRHLPPSGTAPFP